MVIANLITTPVAFSAWLITKENYLLSLEILRGCEKSEQTELRKSKLSIKSTATLTREDISDILFLFARVWGCVIAYHTRGPESDTGDSSRIVKKDVVGLLA